MILIVLCILALSLNDHVSATSRVDDLVARFLIDATPFLFPPSRISLQMCIDHGKIFILVIQLYQYCCERRDLKLPAMFDDRL